MTRVLVIQDMTGKYYTGFFNNFWSADIDDAVGFTTSQNALKAIMKDSDEWEVKTQNAIFPLTEKWIWTR